MASGSGDADVPARAKSRARDFVKLGGVRGIVTLWDVRVRSAEFAAQETAWEVESEFAGGSRILRSRGELMREGTSTAIFLAVLVWIALLLPAVIVWGWARWYKGSAGGTLSSKMSLGGFVFANISVALALAAVVFAHTQGSSPLLNSSLLRIGSYGLILAVLATGCALLGLRRNSPLRWPGLLAAGGVLVFWLFSSI
jgi:hypothetical protein